MAAHASLVAAFRPTSAHTKQLQRPSVALAQHVVQRLVGLAGQAGIASEQARRAVARHLAQLAVANRVGHAKGRLAALPLAEQIAHSPQLQVGLRDPEAVVGAHEDLETLGDLGAHVAEQDAEALLLAPRPAPAAGAPAGYGGRGCGPQEARAAGRPRGPPGGGGEETPPRAPAPPGAPRRASAS